MEVAAIAGGPADVFLTHEPPALGVPEVRAILAGNPSGYPDEALAISRLRRKRPFAAR